jgi:four helix bundle protein
VQSVNANIGEGFGDETPPIAPIGLEIARAEAEESIRHLRANSPTHRISATEYWPVHNLLVVSVKLLTSLLGR